MREIVSSQTEQLRDLAKELRCPILAISSQNRASSYGNGSQALASAKESGDIEYACAIVIAIGEEDPKEGKGRQAAPGHKSRLLALVKNRQGDTGSVLLDWYPSRQHFTVAASGPGW